MLRHLADSRHLSRLEGRGSALIAPEALCTALLESSCDLQQLAPLQWFRHAQVDEVLVRQLRQRPDVYLLLRRPPSSTVIAEDQVRMRKAVRRVLVAGTRLLECKLTMQQHAPGHAA